MSGFNYLIDPDTSDYVLDERGRPVLDQTARTPIQLALRDEFGKWWGDVSRGSEIAAILRGRPSSEPETEILAAVERALQPLKNSGRIVSYSASVTSTLPLTVHIEAVDGGNRKPISLSFNPLS